MDKLILDPIAECGDAKVYLTFAPGKKQKTSRSRKSGWNRDLNLDLQTIKDNNVGLMIGLIEEHEYEELSIGNIQSMASDLEILFMQFPIVDNSYPTSYSSVENLCSIITKTIGSGKSVVIFCKGGLGRTGLIGACYMTTIGLSARGAISHVRSCRKRCLGRRHQQTWVGKFAKSLK